MGTGQYLWYLVKTRVVWEEKEIQPVRPQRSKPGLAEAKLEGAGVWFNARDTKMTAVRC